MRYRSGMERQGPTDVIAVIPARGGSKSIEKKNLAKVGGVSLVERSINAAMSSGRVGRVIVSTDDDEIASVAVDAGAEVVRRPEPLAADWARSIDAVLHVIESENIQDDSVIVMLRVTSPFTTADDIAGALDVLTTGAVVSVTDLAHHPYKACVIVEGTLHPVAEVADLEAPRQLLPLAVRPNGAVYVATAGNLQRYRRFFIDPVVPYRMSVEASLDIDGPDDLAKANELVADPSANPEG